MSGSRLRHLYLRAHMYDNAELQGLALKSSAGFLLPLDPVWGGTYSAAFPKDAEVPGKFAALRAISEKRIRVQANAITAFALGYQQTQDDKYIDGIADIDRYLEDWMMAPDGTFYTNQKSAPQELPRNMSAGEYWLLPSDEARRKYGIPPIDHAVYTDRNGEVIAAYVLAFEATGDADYLATATKAAERILESRIHDDGWMIQATSNEKATQDARMRALVTEERPFLSTQAWFGTAAMYICNPDMCSLPIEDPAQVASQAKAFRGPALTFWSVTYLRNSARFGQSLRFRYASDIAANVCFHGRRSLKRVESGLSDCLLTARSSRYN